MSSIREEEEEEPSFALQIEKLDLNEVGENGNSSSVEKSKDNTFCDVSSKWNKAEPENICAFAIFCTKKLECLPCSFDLLALPDPVLMETLRLVNRADRMRLSHTNQGLRNMIMRNKTPSMDRRKQIPWISFEWQGYAGNYVDFPGYRRSRLDANCTFVEHVQRFTSLFDCDEVYLDFLTYWWDHAETSEMMADFPKFVKALGGRTKLSVMFCDSEAEAMKSLLDTFVEHPQFHSLQFSQEVIPHWTDYCNTVTQVCKANGIAVKTGKNLKYGLRKMPDEEGKRVIQILDSGRANI